MTTDPAAQLAPAAALPATTAGPSPTPSPAPELTTESELVHTLRRLTFGATPERVEHARAIGLDSWLEEQLNPDSLDESPIIDELLNQFTTPTRPARRSSLSFLTRPERGYW